MSTLLLSLLLIILVALGLAMGAQTVERFENADTVMVTPTMVSPTMKNLLTGSQMAPPPASVTMDPLKRDLELIEVRDVTLIETAQTQGQSQGQSQEQTQAQARPATCPPCPSCPDMSQYIRMDEVPCWNCTLP